jgi:uncharacterized membrane protein
MVVNAARTAGYVITVLPSRSAGLLHGLGLGGFIDGILLHQILQWHHMLSGVDDYPVTTLAGLEATRLPTACFTSPRGCSCWPRR